MKITEKHSQYMKNEIEKYLARMGYTIKQLRGYYADYTPRRMNWDITRAAGLISFICSDIYPYANDNHIDTTLRQIIREIEAPRIKTKRDGNFYMLQVNGTTLHGLWKMNNRNFPYYKSDTFPHTFKTITEAKSFTVELASNGHFGEVFKNIKQL